MIIHSGRSPRNITRFCVLLAFGCIGSLVPGSAALASPTPTTTSATAGASPASTPGQVPTLPSGATSGQDFSGGASVTRVGVLGSSEPAASGNYCTADWESFWISPDPFATQSVSGSCTVQMDAIDVGSTLEQDGELIGSIDQDESDIYINGDSQEDLCLLAYCEEGFFVQTAGVTFALPAGYTFSNNTTNCTIFNGGRNLACAGSDEWYAD